MAVAKDGWDAANGFPAGDSTRLAAISLADGASV
jgi:hypothetical protein